MGRLTAVLRRTPAGIGLAVCLLAGVLAGCQSPPQPNTPATGVCRADPFTPGVVAYLEALRPRLQVSASAHDNRTGCWYHYRRGERATTASMVKTAILGALLLSTQRAGRLPSVAQLRDASAMMSVSDNGAASRLYLAVGGPAGMDRFYAELGLTATRSQRDWGLTVTTAEDQARMMTRLLGPDGPLDPLRRGILWALLRRVRADQRWGVSAAGPPGWAVGLKNGWRDDGGSWSANTAGFVSDPAGGGYSVAVLTKGWRWFTDGIPLTQALARIIGGALNAPAPPPPTTTTTTTAPTTTTTTTTAPTTTTTTAPAAS